MNNDNARTFVTALIDKGWRPIDAVAEWTTYQSKFKPSALGDLPPTRPWVGTPASEVPTEAEMVTPLDYKAPPPKPRREPMLHGRLPPSEIEKGDKPGIGGFMHEVGQAFPFKQIGGTAEHIGTSIGDSLGEAAIHGAGGAFQAFRRGFTGDPIGQAAAWDPESRATKDMLADTAENRRQYPASQAVGGIVEGGIEAAAGSRLLRGAAGGIGKLLPAVPELPAATSRLTALGRAGVKTVPGIAEGAAVGSGMAALHGVDPIEGAKGGAALATGTGFLGRMAERIESPRSQRGRNIQAVEKPEIGGRVSLTGVGDRPRLTGFIGDMADRMNRPRTKPGPHTKGPLGDPELYQAGDQARGMVLARGVKDSLAELDAARTELNKAYEPYKRAALESNSWMGEEPTMAALQKVVELKEAKSAAGVDLVDTEDMGALNRMQAALVAAIDQRPTSGGPGGRARMAASLDPGAPSRVIGTPPETPGGTSPRVLGPMPPSETAPGFVMGASYPVGEGPSHIMGARGRAQGTRALRGPHVTKGATLPARTLDTSARGPTETFRTEPEFAMNVAPRGGPHPSLEPGEAATTIVEPGRPRQEMPAGLPLDEASNMLRAAQQMARKPAYRGGPVEKDMTAIAGMLKDTIKVVNPEFAALREKWHTLMDRIEHAEEALVRTTDTTATDKGATLQERGVSRTEKYGEHQDMALNRDQELYEASKHFPKMRAFLDLARAMRAKRELSWGSGDIRGTVNPSGPSGYLRNIKDIADVASARLARPALKFGAGVGRTGGMGSLMEWTRRKNAEDEAKKKQGARP